MASSYDEWKKRYEEAQAEAEANAQKAPKQYGTSNLDLSHEYKSWSDWLGNVNMSDITSGETNREYSGTTGEIRKTSRKDNLASDLGQAVTGAMSRQGGDYRSALATLGLGVAGLLHGDNNYQPEVGSALWRWQEGAEAATRAGEQQMQDSKFGRGKLGSFVMDITSGAVDLAGDQLLNLVAPGAGMTAMTIRAFGGSAEEQRQQGKTISTQIFKGAKSAAIERFTEGLWEIGGVKGKEATGILQGALDTGYANFVAKGGNALLGKMALAFGTEAVEEMASDLLNPLADKVISKVVKGDYDVEDIPNIMDVFYDGLVGGVLGFLGGAKEGVEVQSKVRQQGAGFTGAELLAKQNQAKAERRANNADKFGKAVKTLGEIKATAKEHIDSVLKKADGKMEATRAARGGIEEPEVQRKQVPPLMSDVQETAPSVETPPVVEKAPPAVAPMQTAASPVSNVKPGASALNATAASDVVTSNESAPYKSFTSEELKRTEQQIARMESRAAEAQKRADSAAPNYKAAAREEADGYRKSAEAMRKQSGIDYDVKLEVQPETASKVAAQPQEGAQDVRTENPSEAPGREDISAGGRPGEERRSGSDRATEDGGARPGLREISEARGSESLSERDRGRVSKAKGAVEKRDASKYSAFRQEATKRRAAKADVLRLYNALKNSNLSEDEINERLFSQSVASAIDAALRNGSDKDNLTASLLAAGFDADTAKEIESEILEGEERELPFEVSGAEEEKPQEPKEKPSITKDTKTVHLDNEKYKVEKNDKVINRNDKSGSYLVKRGAGDNYFIVNSRGYIEGTAYDDIGKARARLYGHSDVYQSARIILGDNRYVRFDKGQLKLILDTDRAFTNKDILITQARSQASDDLETEYGSYLGSAVTTDMFTLEFSEKDRDGNFRSKAEIQSMQQRLQQLIDYGIYGKNGKHYVFAGQTASQSKNNIVVMMEEGAYNKFRKNMVGGLDPDEIAMFNPAKYLANQGTYFSPSNADTGVKVNEAIVAADVYSTIHNVTRRFLRTTDSGKDKEALMAAGLTAEQAEKKLNQYRVGEAFLITGDLILKSTDGTGFIMSGKGESFQFRSAGGFKGLLQAFDFVSYLNDVIPYDPKAEYVWTSDDGSKATGGIRYTDKAKGIEILDKWNKWQPINGKKALLFDSTVKFANEYKSSEEFYEKAGNYDVRSIPKENVYGSNPDAGMVEGYTRRGMAQLLRSQTALSDEDIKAVLKESVRDPIAEILKDTHKQAKLFGVDLDSKRPPASSDLKAMLVWYFGEKILNTKQGQKWVSQKLGQIVEDARGGKMYFPKDKNAYQWVAPDPYGLIYAMTSLKYQDAERKALSETGGKGNKGLQRGQISAGNLTEGLTLLGRYPSMEENDVQLRKNVRDKRYDELVEKYGASPDITYFALNDELSLNLDNDYDGDAVLAVQGAIAEAIRNNRRRAGIDNETGAHLGALPTEFVHGQAEKDFIHNSQVMLDAVRAGLDGEDIGTFDIYIDYIQAMPDKMLKSAASKRNMSPKEFRAMLLSDFAAAYKFNVDYAKTGYYPTEFKGVVDSYMNELVDVAEANGYYVGYGKKKQMPVPAAWEYSNKQWKRDAFFKALAKQRELDRRGIKRKAIMYGDSSQNMLYQMYWMSNEKNSSGSVLVPGKKVSDYYEFYKDYLERLHAPGPFRLTNISTISPLSFTNLDEDFVNTLNETYRAIMASEGDGTASNEHRQKLFEKMRNALDIDDEQFSSLMAYVLSIEPERTNWATFLTYDQTHGNYLARNARILGNLATISDAMANAKSDIDKQAESIANAKQDMRDAAINKYAANEIALQQEALALIDELESVTKQIQEKIDAAEKTKSNYENKALNAKTLEAYMKAADGFSRYAERVDALKGKLKIVQQELGDAAAVQQETKELLGRITSAVNTILSDEAITLTSMSDRLTELNDDYNKWLRNFEEEKTKQEFYGIGVDGETGLEYVDLEAITKSMYRVQSEAEKISAQNKAKRAEKPAGADEVIEPPKAPAVEQPVKQKAAPAEPKEPVKVAPKVKESREQKAPAQPKERVETYGDSFANIEGAAKRVADGIGDGAQTVIPDSALKILGGKFGTARSDIFEFGKDFLKAFSAEDDGASVREFAKNLPERIQKSEALRTLLGDPDKGNVAKMAKRLAEVDGELGFRDAAENLSEMIAKEVEELPKTIDTINKWLENNKTRGKIAQFLSGDSTVAKALSTFFGYQRDFINIAMALDNFDKHGGGPGYSLAKKLMDNLYNGTDLYGNAMYASLEARKAFDKSEASKKKLTIDIVVNKQKESHTITMAEAVDFLHNIETLEASKINAWENIRYYFDDDSSIKLSDNSWFAEVKQKLQNFIKSDADAKAFYESFNNVYEMYKDPSREAIGNASGRTVDMYGEGRYYPLMRIGDAKNAKAAKDFNYGMDDAMYTKSRLKVDGGAIRITDPTKRLNAYMSMADKVVSNAELGATLERLDRGGLVPSLTEVVEQRLGKGHTDVIKAAIRNANDFRAETDSASSLLRSIRLNIQTGALFGNFGSMLKQFPSVFNAMGIVDFDDITYGISSLFNKELKGKASEVGAIRTRFQGNYDPDVHDAFEGQTAFNKFWDNVSAKAPWLKVFSDGFQRVDSNAIKAIYLACYHNVLKDGAKTTDPDFETKVLSKFKVAFLLTQPQFAKLMRPYVQTSDNELIRMFGLFKTQPLRNFNTMIRAVNEFNTTKEKYGSDAQKMSEATKELSNTIAGQATASLLFGALGVLAKLLYHRRKDLEDEEGNLDAGKIMARVLMNAAEASGGMMVFGDAAVQLTIDMLSGGKTKEFYGLSAGAISSVADATSAISGFIEKPTRYNAKKAAGYIAQLFGIPLNNAYAILNSAIMYTKDMAGGNEGNYDDILKYLDAEAKAAKKEEEKAAKEAAKAEAKSGADMLADTAKQSSSQSELNSAEEQKAPEISTYLKKPYNALVEAGMTPERSQYVLDFMDTDNNDSIKQSEMWAFYKDNPDYEDYVIAMWNSYGYKTTWEAYKAKHK